MRLVFVCVVSEIGRFLISMAGPIFDPAQPDQDQDQKRKREERGGREGRGGGGEEGRRGRQNKALLTVDWPLA